MPNFPVRNLGGTGIVSDIHPYDLPPNALSAGVNVRFENLKITRGPVCLDVHDFTSSSFLPAHIFSLPPVTSGDVETLVTVNPNFTIITGVVSGTESDLTPSGATSLPMDGPYTSTFLGDLAYLNNNAKVPVYIAPSGSHFAELPAWDSTWRTRSLRSYKDFLIALNVTKGTTHYPTMVKWSDIVQFGNYPGSWDATLTTNSAGENILNEMRTPLVDGCGLRNSFILYGDAEVWGMDYIGGEFLFQFTKLYKDAGVINANCVVEVDGIHYVFDRSDIYSHDGVTKGSIVFGMDKDYIFSGLIASQRDRCFVTHDPRLNEIHFCYPSADRLVGFPSPATGCNRAAVFNYKTQTWTFYDLPNVVASTIATVTSADTYASLGSTTYSGMGGSYSADGGVSPLYMLYAGAKDTANGLSASRIYGLDTITGGTLPRPIALETVKPSFIERLGIDLDAPSSASGYQWTPLTDYKCVQAIYPLLGLTGSTPVNFQIGASDIVGSDPVWGAIQDYDPSVDNKVDSREAGRYLAYRMYYSGNNDFSFSGFDANVTVRGRR